MPQKPKLLRGLRIVSHDVPTVTQAENSNASFMPLHTQPLQAAKVPDITLFRRSSRLNHAPQQANSDTYTEHIAKKLPRKSRLLKGLRIVSHDGGIAPQAAETGNASSTCAQSQSHLASEDHYSLSLGRNSHLNQAPEQANDNTYNEHIAKKKPRKSKLSSSVGIVSLDGPFEPQAENDYASFVPVRSQSHQAAEGHDRTLLGSNSGLNQAPQQANDDTYTGHIAKKKPQKSKLSSSVRMVSHDGPIEPQAENGTAFFMPVQSQPHQAAEDHDTISLGRNARLNQAPQQAKDVTYTEFIDMKGRRFKKPGKINMESVWKMNRNERIFVEVDKHGVPCTREGAILGSFLGAVATNGALAPLDIPKWNHKDYEPFHQKMLSVVEERFMFPPVTRKWIRKSINKRWRDYKSELKAQYFDMTKPRAEIEATVPEKVFPCQWLTLVESWYSEKSQRMSQINSANAKKKKNAHTCGRKSYGRRRKELEEEMGRSPDRLTFYDATHKRKDGTYVDETVKKLMEKAFSLQSKRSKTSNTDITEINEQIFQEIMGDEHNGRVRGVGMGPTPRSYFASPSCNIGARHGSSSSQTNDDVESLKQKLQEMTNKYDEVCGKYDEMSAQYKDVKGNYEDLSAKYDEVSQTLLAMANFMSQKFPELQTSDDHDQVDDRSSSRRSASDNDVQTDNTSYDASDS